VNQLCTELQMWALDTFELQCTDNTKCRVTGEFEVMDVKGIRLESGNFTALYPDSDEYQLVNT
jgi:hypothetical protein